MPLRSWAAFYQAVESERLRHYARMVGVVHPKSPRQAQRDLLRAAARVSGQTRGLDMLGDPRRLRERLAAEARAFGVAVDTAPADSVPEQEKSPPDTPPDTEVREDRA